MQTSTAAAATTATPAADTPPRAQLCITIPTMSPGQRYAGIELDAQGTPTAHLVVLPARTTERFNFKGTQDWAQSVGGEAPSPEQFALIKANCPDVLTESWYWTNRPYAGNASHAWYFGSDGLTHYTSRSAQGGALAVRRLPINPSVL